MWRHSTANVRRLHRMPAFLRCQLFLICDSLKRALRLVEKVVQSGVWLSTDIRIAMPSTKLPSRMFSFGLC